MKYLHTLMQRYGNFQFTHRNKVFPSVLVVLILAFPPGFISNGGFYDTCVVAAGITLEFQAAGSGTDFQ